MEGVTHPFSTIKPQFIVIEILIPTIPFIKLLQPVIDYI